MADQVGSPTYVGDLVDALLQIADGGSIREPVLHAANAGRGQPLRTGPGGVRGRRRRSRSGCVPSAATAIPAPRRGRRTRRLSAARSAEAGLTPLRPWREALTAALVVALARYPLRA